MTLWDVVTVTTITYSDHVVCNQPREPQKNTPIGADFKEVKILPTTASLQAEFFLLYQSLLTTINSGTCFPKWSTFITKWDDTDVNENAQRHSFFSLCSNDDHFMSDSNDEVDDYVAEEEDDESYSGHDEMNTDNQEEVLVLAMAWFQSMMHRGAKSTKLCDEKYGLVLEVLTLVQTMMLRSFINVLHC